MTGWKQCAEVPRWGQAEWEAMQGDLSPGPDGMSRIVPAFLKVAPPGGLDAAAMLALLSQIGDLGGRLTRPEADRLASALPPPGQTVAELRLVVHLPRPMLDELALLGTVTHVGPPVPLPLEPLTDTSPLGEDLRLDGPAAATAPLLGIIDDGIPFLHARTRRGASASRIAALWLQADARMPASFGAGLVRIGRQLDRADIEAMLASGEAEADLYRQTNRSLLPVTQHASTNHLVSHGAQVLDTAGGADPFAAQDAALRAVDILAVQLPPAAVADTSGRRLDPYVVMGLRWMVTEALRLCRARGGPVPLVVNISLGSLGGPGDASAFLSDWIAHEMERYRSLSGAGPGDPGLRVVLPYGNSWRDRLVARAEVRPGQPLVLDWRLLPDDHTASFVELRCSGDPAGLRLHITSPDPRVPPLKLAWDRAANGWRCNGPDNRPRAALLPLPEAPHPALLLALAPSERPDGGPVAPSGSWRIEVKATPGTQATVTAKVQRDDTPAGYRVLGRQPWLDHPADWAWDDELRNHTRPGAGPVTRQGSAAAHAGLARQGALHVGALQGGAPLHPARYTSEGGLPGSAGPDLSALADDGAIQTGRLTSGVLSGSSTRLSGTSVAAPAVTRTLVERLLAGQGTDLADLIGAAPGPAPDSRTGFGALAGQSAASALRG